MSDSKKNKKNQPADSEEIQPSVFDGWMEKFYNFVDNLPASSRRTYLIGWLAVALVLTVAACFQLGPNLAWINGIVGAPAGIIVFFIACAIIHLRKDTLPENSIWRMREFRSQRQRMKTGLIIAAIVIVFMIASGTWLFQYAMGVGGLIIVVAALTVFNILHRTPTEAFYFNKGIPDPRDTLGDDEEYEEAYEEGYEEARYEQGYLEGEEAYRRDMQQAEHLYDQNGENPNR